MQHATNDPIDTVHVVNTLKDRFVISPAMMEGIELDWFLHPDTIWCSHPASSSSFCLNMMCTTPMMMMLSPRLYHQFEPMRQIKRVERVITNEDGSQELHDMTLHCETIYALVLKALKVDIREVR